jgi:hypothetical protein
MNTGRHFWTLKAPVSLWIFAVVFLVLGMSSLFMDMVQGGSHGYYPAIYRSREDMARGICEQLLRYAKDHNGKIPDGSSSTEVFQKLIDEQYVEIANFFYRKFPGKIEPEWNQKLRPENVSWDITAGLTTDSPENTPVVYMPGLRVTYSNGGRAIPLLNPYPKHFLRMRTVSDWWSGQPDPTPYAGVVVCYKDLSTRFIDLSQGENPDGSIPNFIPPHFKPDGKTYRQLTPDGVLK